MSLFDHYRRNPQLRELPGGAANFALNNLLQAITGMLLMKAEPEEWEEACRGIGESILMNLKANQRKSNAK